MQAYERINKVFNNSAIIPFNDNSKFVIMSDCHRGEGDAADNLAKNQNIFFSALEHYYNSGFTYIELGDGDELWENKDFTRIVAKNGKIFKKLMKFHKQNRLYFIYGNHDKVKKNQKWTEENLWIYYNARLENTVELFPDIKVHEGLILHHEPTKNDILLIHGHQADFFNDTLWPVSQFLVRYLWRPLQLIGIKDPTSASHNFNKMKNVEKHLMNWASRNNKMLITGHTHRSMFPHPGSAAYFNDGCCVSPFFIMAIEIEDGLISLVKWSISVRQDSLLYIRRDIIAGPTPLTAYL